MLDCMFLSQSYFMISYVNGLMWLVRLECEMLEALCMLILCTNQFKATIFL